eukprot:jgi/Botrbrau1/1241/Bobra.0163s0034.1
MASLLSLNCTMHAAQQLPCARQRLLPVTEVGLCEKVRRVPQTRALKAAFRIPQNFACVKSSSIVCAAAAVAAEPGAAVESEGLAAPAQQKIRIKLKSYNTNLIKQSCDQILEAAKSTGARVSGPVPLPTRRRIYCVLRSPHVNKDSREHFETRMHQRLIDIKDLTAQTIDELMQLDLPSGVDVEVKL